MSVSTHAAELLQWIDQRATTHDAGGKILGKSHNAGLKERIGRIWRASTSGTDEAFQALCEAVGWDEATQAFYRGAATHPAVAADALCPPMQGEWNYSPAAMDKILVALRLLAPTRTPAMDTTTLRRELASRLADLKRAVRDYSKVDLQSMAGLRATTVTKYTKRAGVSVPGKGGKNHRYTSEETRRILTAIRDGTQVASVKQRCEAALSDLP